MAHKHNLFIVCEGLSGTGKTKFAKALSRKLNAVYFKTPPSPFNKLRNFIDKNFDFKNRYYFYLASVFSASEQIKEILKKQSVVCDRYIYTTLAFHAAIGMKTHNIKYFDFILTPDITFFIDCKNDSRLKRLYKRGLTYNNKIEIKLKTDKKFLKEYNKFSMTILDNSGNIKETLNQASIFMKNIL